MVLDGMSGVSHSIVLIVELTGETSNQDLLSKERLAFTQESRTGQQSGCVLIVKSQHLVGNLNKTLNGVRGDINGPFGL